MTYLLDEQRTGSYTISNKKHLYIHTFNNVRILILRHSSTVPWKDKVLIEKIKILIFLLNQPHSKK